MQAQLAHNLPAPLTSLIGRERDVAETRNLILRGPERLVTLTGVGGSGKTRLALQVAADLRETFPDGVWLVELAPLSDPLQVPEAIAAALGFPEASADSVLGVLVDSLRSRALLLVLDNCEHLIDTCASLVDGLLSACPRVRVLATSRESLQIAGERQRRVLPLTVPAANQAVSPEELARCPSVQLFVERARAVEASFELTAENADAVAQICTLLDGIPLALELAASRIRVLSAEQIVQRLDDCFRLLTGNSRSAPTRQQTLKATLDWSYNLLSGQEQAAFRRLAVFSGGWHLDGAEAVCAGDGLEEAEVLDILARLVDKSLVLVEEQGGEARYRLLEPVRQYGWQRLVESREVEATQGRLVAFCIALAERADLELHGPREAEWLCRLDRELDNIRAVLHWAEARGDVETTLHLGGALYWYLWMRRHLRVGQHWLEPALAPDATVPPEIRAKGLCTVTFVLTMLGEFTRALMYGQEALALYRGLRDHDGLALTTLTLSMMTMSQGDLPAARAFAEESIAFARESGTRWLLGHGLIILGHVSHQQGNRAERIDLLQQALALFQEQGDNWGISYALANLSSLQQDRCDLTQAAALSTVRLYWEQGDHYALAAALEYLAHFYHAGQTECQVKLYAGAHTLRESLGAPLSLGERDDVERYLAIARANLGEARFADVWAEGCAISLEEVVESALNGSQPKAMPTPPASRSRTPGPSDELTRREMEVAKLLAQEYTDREIADELTITEGTAGVHVHHILEKLGFRSRVQVIDWALAQGLIDKAPDDDRRR